MGNHSRINSMILFFLKHGFQVTVMGINELTPLDRKQIKAYGKELKVIETRKYNISKIKGKFLYKAFELGIKNVNKIRKKIGVAPDNKLLSDYFSYECLLIFRYLCKLKKPDIILIEYVYFAYLVQMSRHYIPKQSKLVIDTHDVMYQRCKSFQTHNAKNFFHITKEEEKKALNCFDIIIAINQKDYKSIKRMVPDRTVLNVPHYHEVKKLPKVSCGIISIMYIAGASEATVKTINQFIKYVWVDLFEKYKSGIQLNIYGQVCTKLSKELLKYGVNLQGYIDNLEDAYKENHIIINPVFFGSGLKIKNVEALCYGKPLVTTSVGAQGIEEGSNNAFMLCDKYEDMYHCICSLIENEELRNNLSEKAYQFALKNFTEEASYKQLKDLWLNMQ